MKLRLCIIVAFVLLATATVTLEYQLQCTQMELQGSVEVANQLCVAIQHISVHLQSAVQKMPRPEIKINVDAPRPAR
jgi:hypothetical protein